MDDLPQLAFNVLLMMAAMGAGRIVVATPTDRGRHAWPLVEDIQGALGLARERQDDARPVLHIEAPDDVNPVEAGPPVRSVRTRA